MEGFYHSDKPRASHLDDADNRSLVDLVSESCIRFPKALSKYWTVFAVGFVLGSLLSIPQKTNLETTLERVKNDTRELSQRWFHEQADRFQIDRSK